jgi:hypothetical protein
METHRDSQKPTSEPISREPLGTFTRAIVVEVAGDPRRRAVDCAISVAFHAAVVAVLMILPLLFLGELHPYSFTEAAMITTVPPPLGQPAPSSPAPHAIPNKILPAVKLDKPVWSPGKNVAAFPGPLPSLRTSSAGVGGGIENPLFADLGRAPALVAPDAKPDTETFRPGGDFRVPRVIYGVSLDSPEVAKRFLFGWQGDLTRNRRRASQSSVT